MFVVKEDQSIHITRGDFAVIEFTPKTIAGDVHTFKSDDIVRFTVTEKGKCESVVLEKNVLITEECSTVEIYLASSDTRIGEPINRPVDYWYEISINPDTMSQTPIGYDTEGAKIFRLYPEGGDKQ